MRKCTMCHEEKDESQFNRNRSKKDGMGTTCKPCAKTHMAKYYRADPEKHRALVASSHGERVKKRRAVVAERLTGASCSRCGASVTPDTSELVRMTEGEESVVSAIGNGVSGLRFLQALEDSLPVCVRCWPYKSGKSQIPFAVRSAFNGYRKTDRSMGIATDITLLEVFDLLSQPCSYCGDTEKLTLDRIDNSRGHTKDNVVPACLRCNMMRRDIPYEAWLLMAVGVKEAFQRGLFGNWKGGIKKSTQVSSKGRTSDFESDDAGSTPAA